jgi:hypothetical protein
MSESHTIVFLTPGLRALCPGNPAIPALRATRQPEPITCRAIGAASPEMPPATTGYTRVNARAARYSTSTIVAMKKPTGQSVS